VITQKGLCSVTFRLLPARTVAFLTSKAQLTCIEWGGDIHAPENDGKRAETIREITRKRGLRIFSYGSYFRCDDVEKFKRVSETAQLLGATVIRIWAGTKDAEKFSEREFADLVAIVRRCSVIAQEKGQILAFEYHHHTYNNGYPNTQKLLRAIHADNVKTYWQPAYWQRFRSETERIRSNTESISALKNAIVCVHVYHWKNRIRLPLSFGKTEWATYNKLLPDCYGFLEFVRRNDVLAFFSDAETFLRL